MSNDRNHDKRQHGSGLETAQRIVAITLAALTFSGIIFSAGSLFSRMGTFERQVGINTKRLDELELWRRDIYGTVIDNNAQHKRIEELVQRTREDIAKLELLLRNRP